MNQRYSLRDKLQFAPATPRTPDPCTKGALGEVTGPTSDPTEPPTDFVKKLYMILEDNQNHDIIAWGPQGDRFTVKNPTELANSVLPRAFKHSNFSSFVRQLNKYDFHKLKSLDDDPYDKETWTFRHRRFRAGDRTALQSIKRKLPGRHKSGAHQSSSTVFDSSGSAPPSSLHADVESLSTAHEDVLSHVTNLQRDYIDLVQKMAVLQSHIVQQDGLIGSLMRHCFHDGSPNGSGDSQKVLEHWAKNSLQKQTTPQSTGLFEGAAGIAGWRAGCATVWGAPQPGAHLTNQDEMAPLYGRGVPLQPEDGFNAAFEAGSASIVWSNSPSQSALSMDCAAPDWSPTVSASSLGSPPRSVGLADEESQILFSDHV